MDNISKTDSINKSKLKSVSNINTESRIKTALIGLGRIGWNFHLRELLNHKEYEVCAVVDTDLSRLMEAKEKYGINGYTDYLEMLMIEKPNLTIIASPTIFHEEHAVAALAAGSNVILDKPMAQSLDASHNIYNAYKKSGLKMLVYQPHRFTPEAVVAKEIIESGLLGEIFQIKRSCCGYSRRNDWQAFKDLGGGMLSNYGAHYVDQLIYLSKEKVTDTYCIKRNIATLGDAEDVVKLVMQTENNTILDIDISQASAIGLPLLVIYGKFGAATLVSENDATKTNDLKFIVKYFKPSELVEKTASKLMSAQNREYPSENINWHYESFPVTNDKAIDFYEISYKYFSGKTQSPIPLDETLEVMKILSQA